MAKKQLVRSLAKLMYL